MIRITPDISLDENEIVWKFVGASGPGGQHVNKVATAVQLRFDVAHTPSLPEAVRLRLQKLAGGRLTKHGVIVIDARRFRTQERNRRDALERLMSLVRRALEPTKSRIRTQPSAAFQRRRVEQKRRRGAQKKARAKHDLPE